MKSKLALVIVDGWGVSQCLQYNAFYTAKPKFMNWLWQNKPHTLLHSSGHHVGLYTGIAGNSEVGHLHLGAGRVIKQPLVLINELLQQDGQQLQDNSAWQSIIQKLKKSGGACHIIGLLSAGQVHGSYEHLTQWTGLLEQNNIKYHVHAITDGRDSTWHYACRALTQAGFTSHIQTLCGRFYAMDRDNNWMRSLWSAEAMLVGDKGFYPTFTNPRLHLRHQYKQSCHDEFIQPAVKKGYQGIQPEDLILMTNFRHDRVRQLLQSLIGDSNKVVDTDFENFKKCLKSHYRYGSILGAKPVQRCDLQQIFSVVRDRYLNFANSNFLVHLPKINNTLGEVLSRAQLRQLRVTESEKAAHVTWFFNGGHGAWPGEEHLIVPSIKCTNWNECPQMSAELITKEIIAKITSQPANDFMLINYANCDLVGHSGDFDAILLAVQVVDYQLELLCNFLLKNNYKIIITADHGNAEQMFNTSSQSIHTGHTTNLVPLFLLGWDTAIDLRPGSLIDVAPTILNYYGLPLPSEMQGANLFNV